MERKFILAGIGGQGVVFATKVLSHAAVARGERVIASENHGMSQRGGSVQSHVKIGGSESPLVRRATADAVIAFDRAEAMRNLTYVRSGGSVYVNSTDGLDQKLAARLSELNIQVLSIDASASARESGLVGATNLVILGFAAAHADFGLSLDELKQTIQALGPKAAIENNLKALNLGAEKMTKRE
jgi:indolepyruvate ferredoxin oxidoreductase, beta subunit